MRPAAILAAALTVLTACSTPNLRGREVLQTEVPYTFRNQDLALHVGRPVGARADLPVALFVEGDGGQCQEFRPGLWRRFLQRQTGDFVLVRPRGVMNVACETKAWRELDFHARIAELAEQIAVVKQRVPGQRLVLIGHSAGAHVAILYARDHAADVAGIVNLGGGMQDLAGVLRDLARLRGQDPAEVERVLADVRDHGNRDALPFWNRTYRFWFQMMFSGVQPLWSHPPVPVLIVHGQRDVDSVPFDSVAVQARASHDPRVEFLPFADKGHDLLDAEVFRAVDAWIGRLPAQDR